jgi:predicted phage terminase large subunit-like protein
MYHLWGRPTILLEDAGSGMSVLQDLREECVPAIGIRPERDKVVRMSAQSAKIERGAVCLPRNAPWLEDLRAEILAFPQGAHDDQVDSMSQAIAWLSRPRNRASAVGA